MIEILLALILALTGIGRDIDPGLTLIAEQRVVEIQSDWSHNGQRAGTAEVLAYNETGVEGAVQQWRDSPGHAAILFDSTLTRIGCAMAIDNTGLMWYACILAPGVSAQAPPAVTPASEAPVVMLPDTAMPHEEER